MIENILNKVCEDEEVRCVALSNSFEWEREYYRTNLDFYQKCHDEHRLTDYYKAAALFVRRRAEEQLGKNKGMI